MAIAKTAEIPNKKKASVFAFNRSERWRLSGIYGVVLLLNLVGWGLYAIYAPRFPVSAGAVGILAYTFGLRHAFDADHIAAIDNTTRKFLQEGRRPMGIGFYFSLGHSSVVFVLALTLAVAVRAVATEIPTLQSVGGVAGTIISGGFLWAIGLLNLVVLLDILRIYREMKSGRYDKDELDEALSSRGFLSRYFGRFFKLISKSWHMYPLGFLFGLGFDTATEIALLAITAGLATAEGMPLLGVLCLPILFTAGMSVMDTSDGVFMVQAYDWAFSSPLRKIFYNISVTSLSVAIALLIGTVEVFQVLATLLHLEGGFWDVMKGLDFEKMGYIIVGMFVATWAGSVLIWKKRRIEERWGSQLEKVKQD